DQPRGRGQGSRAGTGSGGGRQRRLSATADTRCDVKDRSGRLVRDQRALEPGDQVLELELAALHALDLQLVVGEVGLHALDLGVEQPVLLAQQGQALGDASEFPRVRWLVHGASLAGNKRQNTACPRSSPLPTRHPWPRPVRGPSANAASRSSWPSACATRWAARSPTSA